MLPSPATALAALMLEALVGYPGWLHRRAPHPVVWVGRLIDALEARWNAPTRAEASRRGFGVLLVVVLIATAGGVGLGLEHLPAPPLLQGAIVVLVATTGLAQRSLFQHVKAILVPLEAGDLRCARTAVSAIVGRDTDRLDAAGVAGAAIESLAESFNDGVVAPVCWLAVGGLPGLFIYKAINTADSLVGHREPRWRSFGWASARTDDLLNLIPARLAGLCLCLAGGRGWRIMIAHAGRHASPNAGWPEAAMAGALGVRLGGPAWYDGQALARPDFGCGRPPAVADVARALGLYRRGCALLWLAAALGVILWPH